MFKPFGIIWFRCIRGKIRSPRWSLIKYENMTPAKKKTSEYINLHFVRKQKIKFSHTC